MYQWKDYSQAEDTSSTMQRHNGLREADCMNIQALSTQPRYTCQTPALSGGIHGDFPVSSIDVILLLLY